MSSVLKVIGKSLTPGLASGRTQHQGTLMGKVNFGGVIKDVCLECLPDLEVGEFAIVHVGFAISRVDEAVARKSLETFAELGMLQEELGREAGGEPDVGRQDRDRSSGD